jgi:hypothetical protein
MQFPRALSVCACIAASLLLGACHSMVEQPAAPPTAHVVSRDSLVIPVSADENRAASFTNKRPAFYYTQTHRNDDPGHAFFRGLNIAGRRIFSACQLIVAELYPNVQASIEGALANFTDASGSLVHADNEAWMDARRELDNVSYIVPFERHSYNAVAGDTLVVEQTADGLIVHHVGASGSEQERVTLAPSPVRREQQARCDAILAGTEFAKPGVAAAHPAVRQSRTP